MAWWTLAGAFSEACLWSLDYFRATSRGDYAPHSAGGVWIFSTAKERPGWWTAADPIVGQDRAQSQNPERVVITP